MGNQVLGKTYTMRFLELLRNRAVRRAARILIVTSISVLLVCCNGRESVAIKNSFNNGYALSMETVDLGFQYDVYLTLKKDGKVVWEDKRFDSRDVIQDVRDAYKSVEWHEDYLLLNPGRLKGRPKIGLSDGRLLGYDKAPKE